MWRFPSKLTVTVTENAGLIVSPQLSDPPGNKVSSPRSNHVSVIRLPSLSASAQIQYSRNIKSRGTIVPKGAFSHAWHMCAHLPNRLILELELGTFELIRHTFFFLSLQVVMLSRFHQEPTELHSCTLLVQLSNLCHAQLSLVYKAQAPFWLNLQLLRFVLFFYFRP